MASLGKSNREGDRHANIQMHFIYSWTKDDYLAAITNQAFYNKVASKLDATSATEVKQTTASMQN
ncbi:hypothetical protein F441_20783 [Phytophthora nicotianae CJ01A1]|uniref:Uncharacterized protein n=4 Tax=Phytophthora nicotianae TaxID=4792 RepID=W2PJF9_PHYN3|nr:hypothetical protein PPTG_18163 [Phytophthora nicotianae INRA-310]ETI32205.1 hypothetical protein F443_20923 [Phytophthora nicotianae P1569]ETK72570.1 hypothetical protein L915_20337 [Phytophthora nicotianae]ETP02068.1 hypothetical protein F441_20783 [Phytophthora nicotianae CJ01A1]ETL26027.1 hypothetical protein L916_20201 [Phytophthora nicotianae]ETN00160.1 hypothetical protein PPTG_18163 [Phytophthora nicotianae INRA-310]